MKNINSWIVFFVLLSLLTACSGNSVLQSTAVSTVEKKIETPTPELTPTPAPTATSVIGIPEVSEADQFAFKQNARLGRGVNLGNALEAPREGEWGVTLQEAYFDLIQQAGFTSVRVPKLAVLFGKTEVPV